MAQPWHRPYRRWRGSGSCHTLATSKMKLFAFMTILALLSGCQRSTPRAFLSPQKIETARRNAQVIMLAETNHPLVWNDAQAFTNVTLIIWGEGKGLRCRFLLTDDDFESSHGCRYQEFEYDFMSETPVMKYGLGTMVE